MPKRKDNELRGIIAGPQQDLHNFMASIGKVRPNDDVILKTQSPKNADYTYPWGLYDELLDLDPHLAGVVDVRKVGVTSLPVLIQPGDDSARAAMIAQWVEWWLSEIGRREYFIEGGFFQDRLNLLSAIPYGVSVLEIEWDDVNGWLLPVRMRQPFLRQCRFDWDARLRLVKGAGDTEGTPVPDMKFLVFVPYMQWENPYGTPKLRRVFFFTIFKRTGYRFWAVFLDKYGSPTIVGKYPPNASPAEKDDLYKILYSYQQETGVQIPQDFAVELLEARRGGGADYSAFAEACNREVSKGILGQNLTTEVKGGSYAAANIHQMIRRDILETDARLEMKAWDRLFRWAVDINFAEPRPYPHFQIRTDAASETRTRLEVIRQMASIGYPLSRKQISEDLGLRPPESDADTFVGQLSAQKQLPWGNPGEDEPGAQSPGLTEPPTP